MKVDNACELEGVDPGVYRDSVAHYGVFLYLSNLTMDALLHHWPMIPLTACFYVAVIVLMIPLSKALRLSGEKASTFRMVFTFGNTGFIGLPLLSAVFAESGVINLLMFMVVDHWYCGHMASGRLRSQATSHPSDRV